MKFSVTSLIAIVGLSSIVAICKVISSAWAVIPISTTKVWKRRSSGRGRGCGRRCGCRRHCWRRCWSSERSCCSGNGWCYVLFRHASYVIWYGVLEIWDPVKKRNKKYLLITKKFLGTNQKKKQDLPGVVEGVVVTSGLGQPISSELSLQSIIPLQRTFASTHWRLLHCNSFTSQVGVPTVRK